MEDEKVWKVVLTSWEPFTNVSGVKTYKPKTTWTAEEDKLANVNPKALNVIFNGVDL
ncbi:hypothetical protein PVK06_002702 [Gossypium arboreum]|uniref:Uncharacterized protein n=1 Tax=Gossypium arboreum TaxID=29729 RepID=A0ABR0R480_GOSAR|nr:hypothetical protein PVK06_002702 [Gossypium arboreum]